MIEAKQIVSIHVRGIGWVYNIRSPRLEDWPFYIGDPDPVQALSYIDNGGSKRIIKASAITGLEVRQE